MHTTDTEPNALPHLVKTGSPVAQLLDSRITLPVRILICISSTLLILILITNHPSINQPALPSLIHIVRLTIIHWPPGSHRMARRANRVGRDEILFLKERENLDDDTALSILPHGSLSPSLIFYPSSSRHSFSKGIPCPITLSPSSRGRMSNSLSPIQGIGTSFL